MQETELAAEEKTELLIYIKNILSLTIHAHF